MLVKTRLMMIARLGLGYRREDMLYIYRIVNIRKIRVNFQIKGMVKRREQNVGWLNGLAGGITFLED